RMGYGRRVVLRTEKDVPRSNRLCGKGYSPNGAANGQSWVSGTNVWPCRKEKRDAEDNQGTKAEVSPSLRFPECLCACILRFRRQESSTHVFGAGLRRTRPSAVLFEGGATPGAPAIRAALSSPVASRES